jgi:hypothetical protein
VPGRIKVLYFKKDHILVISYSPVKALVSIPSLQNESPYLVLGKLLDPLIVELAQKPWPQGFWKGCPFQRPVEESGGGRGSKGAY